MTWVLITGLLILLVFLVSVSFVRIRIRYERKGEDVHLTLGVTWLRHLTYTVSIPETALMVKAKQALKEISLPGLLYMAARNFARLRRSLTYASAHTRVKKLEWSSEFGLADAAHTGAAAGLAWSVKGVLLSAVSAHTRLETTPRIQIRPDFQKAFFHTLFDCIFEIRIGHIMIAGLKAVRPG